MPIVEVFAAALITVLFERLASKEVIKFARREGLESQLQKWRKMLMKIEAVLDDAEHRQVRATRESPVNLWLQELRDLAYDADDILDEFAYDILAKMMNASSSTSASASSSSSSSRVHRLGRCFSACSPSVVVSNARMESRVRAITARFEHIVKQQDLLRLSINTPGTSWNLDHRSTTCVFDESAIFGRVKDKDAIVQLLLQDRDEVGIGVLPIVGMGGLGKTTLAQLVYNDSTVQDSFPVRAWTCVSDDFDCERITISILESLNLIPRGKSLNALQVQLREALSDKKFLIVLDDVWNEDYRAWDTLCAPFSSGLFGSMVIVTTRSHGVASLVGNFSPYCLMQLSDDICLSIFLRHALGATSSEAQQNLVDIGLGIAKRCKGLPLAAKMLGGLLRNQHRPEIWQNILQSDIWDIPASGILPVLQLSYYHLPSHLKQCFAYCSLAPADYEFDKQHLILLWMAEGFLHPRSDKKKQMEELGGDYFDELTSRSFFQPSSTDSSKFIMHDLIHDLARHVASDAYLFVGNHDATIQDTTTRVRHASFVPKNCDTLKRLGAFGDMQSLRTFLPLPIGKHLPASRVSSKVLSDLLMKLTCMRVLSLCGYYIEKLPDSVGKLKHLRYLNMTCTTIKRLPESVTCLFSLLALILRGCKNLIELPASIGNLVNLWYLDLDGTPQLLQMPSGIKFLTRLQKLSKFVVGKEEELVISDLKNLSSLRGKLWIQGLHNVVNVSSAFHASLKSQDGLEELCMEWRDEFDDSRDEEIERQVLHHLQPPKSLRELEIVYYGGKQLPCWMGDPFSTPNIVRLSIRGCKKLTLLPPLGRLPLLKELTLNGLDGVTSVGDELYAYNDPLFAGKAFPSLEVLTISQMLGLEEWSCSSGREGLPNLRALFIHDCPQLTGKLPSHLSSVENLQIHGCPQLTTPLATWSLTSLGDLYLGNCVIEEGYLEVHLSSLTKLTMVSISDIYSLNMLNRLPCLHELVIEGCPRLVSFGEISLPATLKRLTLSTCEALESLPLMHTECFLDVLEILGCNSLEHFPVVKEAESGELVVWRVKSLLIRNNHKLLEDMMLHGIEFMKIMKCPSTMCFPASGKKLPSSLNSLMISEFENLQTLMEGTLLQDYNMLLTLQIRNCQALTSIGKVSTSLKILTISSCSELVALPEAWPGSSLETIHIDDCQNLQEFPESLVQNNIHNLKMVSVYKCKNLRSLPYQMNNLTNLLELCIERCWDVRWSNISQGGGGLGLPSSLKELRIGKTLLYEDLRNWGLHYLTSLEALVIIGKGMDDVISFPEYDDGNCFFLPTSITSLTIGKFKNLKSLSSVLKNLRFLKHLVIYDCPKLLSLPREGFPSTLEVLSIYRSPIVVKHCRKDGGDYWPIISHVPLVLLDSEVQ